MGRSCGKRSLRCRPRPNQAAAGFFGENSAALLRVSSAGQKRDGAARLRRGFGIDMPDGGNGNAAAIISLRQPGLLHQPAGGSKELMSRIVIAIVIIYPIAA